MTTVDFRHRFDNDAVSLDPGAFLDEQVAVLPDGRRSEAGRAATRLGLAPLTLDVEDEALTFVADDERLVVQRGADDALVVALDRAAFSDLMQDVASAFGLHMTGRANVVRGGLDTFLEWEPVLRCFLDGRPVYEPGTISFHDRAGAALDLHRSFTLESDPSDIGHFLAEAGYLHLEGVFTETEMAAVSAELDDAIAEAERDDGASWWARTEAGEWYPARILGFNQKSPTLRELLGSDRFRSIGSFTDDRFVQRDPDVGDSAEGLLKKVGVVEGFSDVSWHKDCSLGGHSRRCCSLTVGISVTGAGRENGELGAVAGSHRANVPMLGVEGLDLPRVPLPTRTGDVTVHCSCTLHMSRPPVSAQRRVVYSGFDLAPRSGDRRVELDHAEIRRQRAALSDYSGRLSETPTERAGSYEL
jgi:Phytanoyl-CoA dioxygenase (PhyH)